MRERARQYRGVLIGIVATIAGLAAIAVLVVASGIYNVAASSEHFAITRLLLEIAMRRSVATYSLLSPDPPATLDDPDLVRLGAGHYMRGCAFCHGAPGEPTNPVVEKMLPPPPALADAVGDWSDAQLFWIVKHGLKYTGMPAWPAQGRDDEVWPVVAFLRQLPGMTAEQYSALTTGKAGTKPGLDRLPRSEDALAFVAECARCHGDEQSPPISRLVPVLAGQTQEYLVHALRNYADGLRQSGIMQPLAVELGDDAKIRIAHYYAGLSKSQSRKPRAAATPEQIERGRQIATEGILNSGIPPCLACHSGNAAATFPLLSGQHATYLIRQLKLWQDGLRDRTAQGAIMATIARRLTDEQIRDVAAYLENRNPAEDERTASSGLSRTTP